MTKKFAPWPPSLNPGSATDIIIFIFISLSVGHDQSFLYVFKKRSMGPVMIWPQILAVTSGLLKKKKYKINFNYIENSQMKLTKGGVLVTIFAEFLYFLELSDFCISRYS